MGRSTETGGRRSSRRTAAMVGAVVLAVVMLAVAMVFSSSQGAAQVAANARTLHWTNATDGSAGIARAALAQAVFFAVDEELGVATSEAAAAALTEAEEALAVFEAQVAGAADIRDDHSAAIEEAIAAFTDSASRVVAHLSNGDPTAAEQARRSLVEPSFAEVAVALDQRQESVVEAIDASEDAAGRVAQLTRAAVTLMIPAAAMVLYWVWARRQLREREIEMQARLEAEQSISAAKDEFIAGVSHELRTPLTSIYGFSEVLVENDMVDPAMSRELIGLINSQSADLSRMVEDLLTTARLDADALNLHPEPVPVVDALEAEIKPFQRAGRLIGLECEPAVVLADPLRLRQIVRNLVSNAARHGGPQTVISGEATEGGRYVVAVADDGDGVTDDAADGLFDRFVNQGGKALLAGSVGLGLAVARTLVEQMDGSIRYEREDRWTRFVFDLPLAATGGRGQARVADSHDVTVVLAPSEAL